MRNGIKPNGLLSAISAAVLCLASAQAARAGNLNLVDAPLFLTTTVAPLNMLVVGRDHKLYYEAYNDASDLDGDGKVDIGYKPAKIDYFGYFDSHKCYSYGSDVFTPISAAPNKTCSGAWSGDFLNYVTTSRIDALRKVLYGGSRYIDTATDTVLQRSHIPQDAHSWGKEYESVARDGYDITQYTPLSMPTAGTRHLFANTTLRADNTIPRMRILQSETHRIWEWVSIERPVAGNKVVNGGSGPTVSPTDYTVRVRVCASGLEEANCRTYSPTSKKPIGLLQEYGENDRMLFGLISGSYAKNTSGGVLRKQMGTIRDEIDSSTGQFLDVGGILRTLDRFRTVGFGTDFTYSCGWIATRPINEGECEMWGNPVAEMMYEAVRYFAGKGAATPAYNIASSGNSDANLGLSLATWDNPYSSASRACAKPFQTVISDINPSYDTDLPGSYFNSFSGDLANFNVSTIANKIWTAEFGGSREHFIGQSGAVSDGAPTPKTVTSFANIRGLSPEEPTKNGGYYSASVAYHGLSTDLNSAVGSQKMQTFAVALASPLPKIDIPVGNGRITLVPFAKSVGGSYSISATSSFQPTNQIVDFYAETITDTYGRFRVNFEDVEQGADHDMDAIVIYEYTVVGDEVNVTLTSEYAAGSIIQHMGYIVSGSSADGTYLVVRDSDTAAGSDPDYHLDKPNTTGVALPLTSTRTFKAGTSTGATLMKDPLWFAAKWGGFKDSNNTGTPDLRSEWTTQTGSDPNPDNYFLVTNALTLSAQLGKAFDEIIGRVGSASSAAVNSGTLNSDTRVFQALFNSTDWSGDLLSSPFTREGTFGSLNSWRAATTIPAADSRKIFVATGSGSATAFRWDNLSDPQKLLIQQTDAVAVGQERLDYLRGDHAKEQKAGGTFRNRSNSLGDIINSSPIIVGRPSFRYSDSMEASPYSSFQLAHKDRPATVYVGANDGMLHAFSANSGEEYFSFIPTGVFANLYRLSNPSYSHRYYVDGTPTSADVYYGSAWHTVLVSGLNAGGQSVFALNVTAPQSYTQSSASTAFLWEFTDANDADLGYTFSRPSIVKLNNGRWAAIFGNGYNNTVSDAYVSTTGNAALYIVDIQNGNLIRKITTDTGRAQDPTGQSRPNGLGTPAVIDVNGDNIADFVYAGDLFGNLWKFSLGGNIASSWNSTYSSGGTPLPLFRAKDSSNRAQPITAKPSVSRGKNGVGHVVLFGTGKYLEPQDEDVANLTPQTFYGLFDPQTGTSTDIVTARSQLTQQTILTEVSKDFDGHPVRIRTTSETPISATANRGWYLDLVSPSGFEGEMQVSDSLIREGHVIFTTIIPNADLCSFGGRSWLMEMDLFTGSRPVTSVFDLNEDGKHDENDYGLDKDGKPVPVTGVQLDEGMVWKPAVVSDPGDDGTEEPGGGGSCPGGDFLIMPGTTGGTEVKCRYAGPRAQGRQSWRQAH